MRYATTVCIGLACVTSCRYAPLPELGPLDGDAGSHGIDASTACAGGPGTWTRLTPVAAPPARYEHAMAYDPVRQRVVLFGGRTGPNNEDLLDDTWEWNGTNWIEMAPSVRPTPRSGSPMVFNEAAGKVLLYGGYTQGGGTQDTWHWNGTTWQTTSANTAPSYRHDHGLAYDLSRDTTVLFGGFLGGVGIDGGTWELDTVGSSWSDRAPASAPSPRLDVGLAYDVVRNVSVLFGGSSSGNDTLDETWEWNGASWTNVRGECTPSSSSPAMAYDAARSRVMVYTGADVWAWNGSVWARLETTSAPTARSEAALAYDGQAQAMIMFGGLSGSTPVSDTWTFR
jgi:hypothetical protein